MSFYQRYELLELVKDDGIKTFTARQNATGQTVMVHLFVNPHTPEMQSLLQQIPRLSPGDQQLVVEAGDNQGTPYLVTKHLPNLNIRQFLSPAAAPPPSAPAAAAPHRDMTAEFRRLAETFHTPDRPPAKKESARMARPSDPNLFRPAAPGGTPLPPPHADSPTMALPTLRQTPVPAPPAPPAPADFDALFGKLNQGRSQTGEATQVIPAGSAPAPANAPEPPKAGPGEFTQMFITPMASPKPAAPEPPPAP